MTSDIREENLYPLWEEFCLSKSWSDDLRLQGINAGILNIFEGPDFQGADFELDGKIYHGDVEIHRSTKEWYQHLHHLDRRYNFVQLHLVLDEEPGVTVLTSDKREIKTLNIGRLRRSSHQKYQKPNCRLSNLNPEIFSEMLVPLSLDRLNYKIARIKNLAINNSYDQIIYLMLMRVLGSPNNSTNFEYIATILQWEEIINLKQKNYMRDNEWQDYFLFRSGLSNKKSIVRVNDGHDPNKKPKLKNSPLSSANWRFAGQRPKNSPVRHIKIVASWLYSFSNKSIYYDLKNIISQRLSVNNFISKVEDFFSLKHASSGQGKILKNNKRSEDNWGRDKIIEIIGNAILPLYYWESQKNSSFGFIEYLEDIYLSLPQITQYAKLKNLEQIFQIQRPVRDKFYKNQGLLHLQINYCKKGGCELCPILKRYKEIDKNFENI